MPTYEYECKSCRHSFDVFQSIKDEPLKVCPECGRELRRVINGGTGVIFKGGGFYVTDNGGKSGAKTSNGSKTTETKTAGTESPSPCPACAKSESCPKAVSS